MAGMPDVNKRNLSVQVTRELYYQLRREAREHKLDLAVYVRLILSEAVKDVELTEEDAKRILKEIRDARNKRKETTAKDNRRR